MKILIIANGYPEINESQWGCFERDQALALKNAGHTVSIMYVDRRFRKHWRKIGKSKRSDMGLSIYGMYYLPLGWLRDKVSYRLHQKVVMWMYDILYRDYVKDHGSPDVLYAHFQWNISYVSRLRKKYGIPLIGVEHWSGMTSETLPPLSIYQGNIAYSTADKILAVSKSLQSDIYRHFGKESTVVYDMLGQEFIASDTRTDKKTESFLSGGAFQFVAIGSLIYRKGFDVLIDAFAKSNLAKKKCRVVIIGDGPEKMKLIKQTEEFGLSDCVSLVGRKTKDEIISIMHDSHAFVLSSRAETFGVVCIEALSQGLPNIATICGGPEEFVNERNGLLVEPNDVDALSEAMCKMFENHNQYDKVAIANECINHFSPSVIAKQLSAIFEEVINNRE